MVFEAIRFVADAHDGHTRKGTRIPYISHLVNVMKILCEADCDDEVIAAGLLHDSVEDTQVTLEQVEAVFGKRVADIVAGASESDKLQNEGIEAPWRERKQHTIDFVESDADLDVLLVSCADKLDNARAIHNDYRRIGDKLWERFNADKDEQRWYYQSLAAVFARRGEEFGGPLTSLSGELSRVVCEIFGGDGYT